MKQHESTSGAEGPSTAVLVEAFFAETEASFRLLLDGPSTKWTPRLRHSSRSGLEFTTPDRIEGFFLAECEFQTPDLIGDISFGDREYFINTIVSPFGRPCRYGLWEWADAVDRPDLVPRRTDFVTDTERLRRIVHGMADALMILRQDVARADATILERMNRARAVVQAEQEARWREAEHLGTATLAARAFREHRWARVIELLESIKDRLTPAESAKLAYAHHRVQSAARPPV